MKRTWLVLTTLVVAVILSVGLAVALAQSLGRDPETWEDITDSYVRYRGTKLGRLIVIEQAVKARTPSNFTSEMNLHTYGDAPYYYAVDETFPSDSGSWPKPYFAGNLTPAPTLLTQSYTPYPSTMTTMTGGGFRTSRPIPYPPTEVWCVLLKLASEDAYSVVFANLHMDMYNAQWIIHEGEKAPFTQGFLEHVASLGCDLDLSGLP